MATLEDEGGVVRPCTMGCGADTRPEKVRIADAPGTVKRRVSGACMMCQPPKGTKRRPVVMAEADMPPALTAFLAARRRRLDKLRRIRLARRVGA